LQLVYPLEKNGCAYVPAPSIYGLVVWKLTLRNLTKLELRYLWANESALCYLFKKSLDPELVTDIAFVNCWARDGRWNKEADGRDSSSHGTWTRVIETLGGFQRLTRLSLAYLECNAGEDAVLQAVMQPETRTYLGTALEAVWERQPTCTDWA